MPARRKQPARRASLRAQRYSPTPSPPEPAIETMEGDGSGEDMDVSDDAPLDNDEVSSEQAAGLEDDASASENNQEDEIDVEDIERDAMVEDEEEEQEDELSSSSPTPPPKPTKAKSSPQKPRLKIKLRLPGGPSNANATPTPSDEMPLRPGRKGHPKHADVESEDEEEDESSTSSTPYTGPTRMTQRQAALAGMVDTSEHLVLEETVSKRKKLLNETELALKREETARKRKNLTAKKLEDEKIETINRLLKKQTRPRGKKGAAGATADADEDGEQEGEETSMPAAPPPVPTLFRWVSSSKSDGLALSFSVPPSLLLDSGTPQNTTTTRPPPSKRTPQCDVSGCTLPRKYKLVKDPTKGGCGIEHLKALQVS
ncbi:hypothetical protein ACEPAH_6992 [Sanghuangporus vaninii]